MESQPQNPEFRINPENFHLCLCCACLCSVSLPRGAMGWSAVCDCGISWSYSLFVYLLHPMFQDAFVTKQTCFNIPQSTEQNRT